MAKLGFASFLFILVSSYLWAPAVGFRGMVGGRTEIKEVKTNEEVQQLGKYSVEEYNMSHGRWHDGRDITDYGYLTFSEVVEAQKQVVSGLKYYMKIATTQNGIRKTFDAEVVVKPWLHSKQLLHFSPSSNFVN